MSEIEKIQRYIDRTRMSTKAAQNYAIVSLEIKAFFDALQEDWFHAIVTIYDYGRAKGYRAAKAEVRA